MHHFQILRDIITVHLDRRRLVIDPQRAKRSGTVGTNLRDSLNIRHPLEFERFPALTLGVPRADKNMPRLRADDNGAIRTKSDVLK